MGIERADSKDFKETYWVCVYLEENEGNLIDCQVSGWED